MKITLTQLYRIANSWYKTYLRMKENGHPDAESIKTTMVDKVVAEYRARGGKRQFLWEVM